MSAQVGGQPTEEELRAYEEELSRITSGQLVIQAAASLLNVGGMRLGLAEGSEAHRDLDQVCDAIDAVKALLPILERRMSAAQTRPLRDALAQLQMAYARITQAQGAGEAAGSQPQPAQQPPAPGEPPAQQPPSATGAPGQGGAQQPSEQGGEQGPGPAERSGRLWVPGR